MIFSPSWGEIFVMKIAVQRLNGTEMSSASAQVRMEPTMKISAPTCPPPASVSDGFHWEENRNSVIE